MKILILNGPNLNMLGKREPKIYGGETLDAIKTQCENKAKREGAEVEFRQSNVEGELVEWIQKAAVGKYDGLIINPAAYTHTSVAILDALKMLSIPIIEIHLSNIFKREEFRHKSYVSLVATGIISGLGSTGYLLAMDYLLTHKYVKND